MSASPQGPYSNKKNPSPRSPHQPRRLQPRLQPYSQRRHQLQVTYKNPARTHTPHQSRLQLSTRIAPATQDRDLYRIPPNYTRHRTPTKIDTEISSSATSSKSIVCTQCRNGAPHSEAKKRPLLPTDTKTPQVSPNYSPFLIQFVNLSFNFV